MPQDWLPLQLCFTCVFCLNKHKPRLSSRHDSRAHDIRHGLSTPGKVWLVLGGQSSHRYTMTPVAHRPCSAINTTSPRTSRPAADLHETHSAPFLPSSARRQLHDRAVELSVQTSRVSAFLLLEAETAADTRINAPVKFNKYLVLQDRAWEYRPAPALLWLSER